MHPLNTLVQAQRHQVRQQSGRPTPRRRSETEEHAVRTRSQRRSPVAVALTAAALFTTALLLATLALV